MLAKISEEHRKADTRQKIKLGGLVIKAGLADEIESVILGAVVLASKALRGVDAEVMRRRFQAAGDEAFSGGNHEA
jgi:Conjugal transfer protein TraD